MKKVFLFIMTILLIFITGCYNYGTGSQYGRLEDISFYDINYQEIEGKYIDFFRSNEYFKTVASLAKKQPLNSPAPIYYYYCTDINIETDIIVRFKIKLGNNCEFDSLRINDLTILIEDFYNIEIQDKYIYADYLCSNINLDNNKYSINNLYIKRTINDKEEILTGSTWLESRIYISGFYFNIVELE